MKFTLVEQTKTQSGTQYTVQAIIVEANSDTTIFRLMLMNFVKYFLLLHCHTIHTSRRADKYSGAFQFSLQINGAYLHVQLQYMYKGSIGYASREMIQDAPNILRPV